MRGSVAPRRTRVNGWARLPVACAPQCRLAQRPAPSAWHRARGQECLCDTPEACLRSGMANNVRAIAAPHPCRHNRYVLLPPAIPARGRMGIPFLSSISHAVAKPVTSAGRPATIPAKTPMPPPAHPIAPIIFARSGPFAMPDQVARFGFGFPLAFAILEFFRE